MPVRALLVDDQVELRAATARLLSGLDLEILEADGAVEALRTAREREPELILLDLGLPDGDGLDVCSQLRAFSDAYIVIVSARQDSGTRVEGLRRGADDYIAKPYHAGELIARVQALLRRPRRIRQAAEPQANAITVDASARIAYVDGEPVQLTRIEFDLLAALAWRPGQTCSRDALINYLWGPGWVGDPHVVDVHVGNLRRKLEHGGRPRLVQTVRGIGFRLTPSI